VPFQVRALASAVGDLHVSVADDYTFYVGGAPLVTNAAVIVSDPYTGDPIVKGVTDATGTLLLTNILEGQYQIDVSADKHTSFRGSIKITAGTVDEVKPFLDRKTVSYRWTVVPTEIQDNYRVVLQSVFRNRSADPRGDG